MKSSIINYHRFNQREYGCTGKTKNITEYYNSHSRIQDIFKIFSNIKFEPPLYLKRFDNVDITKVMLVNQSQEIKGENTVITAHLFALNTRGVPPQKRMRKTVFFIWNKIDNIPSQRNDPGVECAGPTFGSHFRHASVNDSSESCFRYPSTVRWTTEFQLNPRRDAQSRSNSQKSPDARIGE